MTARLLTIAVLACALLLIFFRARPKEQSPEDVIYTSLERNRGAAVKGIALQQVAKGSNDTRFRVEYVYQDRNEVQFVTLAKTRGRWNIVRTEDAPRAKPAVAYGTPVE